MGVIVFLGEITLVLWLGKLQNCEIISRWQLNKFGVRLNYNESMLVFLLVCLQFPK